MNALEFLIANADAVRKVWIEHIAGHTLKPRAQTVDTHKGNKFISTYDAWLVVNAYSKGSVYVHIVHKDVLPTAKLSDFINGSTVSDNPTNREKALTVARLASVHSICLPRNGTKVTRECVSLKVSTFLHITDTVQNWFPTGSGSYALYECPTSFHKADRTYKIRKSVLLKEAGGSTEEEGNVSLAEHRKNSFRPACISITIQKPGMQDGEYSRRIRIHGTAKIEHFTPEQIAASQNPHGKSATAWAALLSKWSSGTRWAAAPYDKMAEELKDVPYQSISDQLLYKVFADIIAAQNPRADISTNVNWPELANQQTKIMQDIKDAHQRHLAERISRENQQRKTVMSPEISAPYGLDADKQYAEEHSKQLASLDALIASPSMPDACKTLLRGCRHQFERADTYDQLGGERSMDKVVPMFNILYGKDLTKEQGWMFMMLVKAVRSANGNYSADSYEDGGSYWGLADEDAKKERK